MIIRKISVRSTEGEAIPKPRHFSASVGQSHIYCTAHEDGRLELLQTFPWNAPADKELVDYFKRYHMDNLSCQCQEITASDMEAMLGQVEGVDVNVPAVMAPAGLMPFVAMPFSMAINVAVCEESAEPAQAVKASEELHSTSLTEELTRIAAVPGQTFRGHPFIYVCQASTMKKANRMSDLLFAALRGAGRLPSGRVCQVDLTMGKFPEQVVADIFRGQSGASFSLELEAWPNSPMDARKLEENLRIFAEAAQRHRSSVLTVIHVAEDAPRYLQLLQDMNLRFLPLTMDSLDHNKGQRMLDKMARECGFRKAPAALLQCLPRDQESFTGEQVEEAFNKWYDDYLLKKAYPQYKSLAVTREDKPAENTPSAMEKLESLVGLTEAKAIIRQITDLAHAQQIYRQHGMAGQMPCLHMAFVGAPGTAKTTVARLVGQILRECGALKKGHLVETSRSTLVSDHVGGTAMLVRQAFEKAKDGILLIDEAYSLLDDREGLFGDEAISEIVKQSEDPREDTVMILTGDREPMAQLLDRNAGLRSRVGFVVDFPEYTEDELMEIVELRLQENKRLLTDSSRYRVRHILHAAMTLPNFGNGRYARSLVEKAMLRQASRVMTLPPEQVTDEDIRYLTAEDFGEVPQTIEIHRTIGFAV